MGKVRIEVCNIAEAGRVACWTGGAALQLELASHSTSKA